MSTQPSLRRAARAVLPRSAISRLGTYKAHREQRAYEKQLDGATDRFEAAYASYWTTGTVPGDAADLLFLAAWSSGGTFPRSQARIHARTYEPAGYRSFSDDLLASLDPGAVAASVESRGYYVAPFTLDEAAVDDILAVLEAGPAEPRGDGMGGRPAGVPDPSAPTWWMDPARTMRSPATRRLLRERRLAEVGGRYLAADPQVMSIALWKSFAWRTADRNSAQQFHYDNDRASFVKMFVYLTDVDEHNGPHTYVPGSHHERPKELLHGGRLSDGEVARFFPEDRWVTITGPKGTVFFADTQGFHKGGQVQTGSRAMFQINLATDRFGISEPAVGPAADAADDLRPRVSSSPRYFSQLFTPEHREP